MRAVWTFWVKPFKARTGTAWVSEKYFLLSWVLSLETAKRHYHDTCLFTDDEGARMLIDGIGLRFESVSTALNALVNHNPEWWLLGKLYTYRAQSEPFVHLDSDEFLWKPLPEKLDYAPVFAQNPEYFSAGCFGYEPEAVEFAVSAAGQGWIPEEWQWYRTSGLAQRGECCGIFGGNRLDFISHYAATAIKMIEHPRNELAWSGLNEKFRHSILIEQYLLSACVEYHQNKRGSPYQDIGLEYLFDANQNPYDPTTASVAGFTHLLGGSKGNQLIANRLEKRVMRDNPDQYERCLSYLRTLK
jgi:hypothetical protein